MALLVGVSHLVVGVGAAHLSTQSQPHAAVLEWVSGLTLVTGLGICGFLLGQQG